VSVAAIKVLLADDQVLVRSGFKVLLDAEDDISVVGEAATGAEAVERARATRPDVILMDIRMPGWDGIKATSEIVATRGLERVRVLILTTYDTDAYVFEALQAGASGFLLKDAGPDLLVRLAEAGFVGFVSSRCGYEDFLRELRSVVRQEWSCSPELGGALIRSLRKRPMPSEGEREYLLALTPREREIAHLLARRLSNKEIATVIGVEPGTVKNHVHNILTKLGLNHRWELGSRSR